MNAQEMPALFMLSSSDQERMALKTFSSSTTNGKATVKITLETTDMYALASCLKDLGEVFERHKKRNSKRPSATGGANV
ncbi:hypothetical protein [Celeribacter sp.]|uniref:hypothetical protein n=1 Tax=Celeribacter sp. TaxID=1890673 RepID=UPI003A8FFBB2